MADVNLIVSILVHMERPHNVMKPTKWFLYPGFVG